MNFEVSVIIVNYNNHELLKTCLTSLYKYARNVSFEVIIVDNASTESGLENTVKGFPNLTLIRNNENRGFAAANNQGVKIAKGKYVLLLNNDTEFIEDVFSPLFNFLKNNPKTLVAPKLLYKNLTFQNSAYKFPNLLRLFYSSFFIEKLLKNFDHFNKYYIGIEKLQKEKEVDAVLGAFMFMEKSLYEKLNGLDERFFFYHEDTDFCFRLKKGGGRVYYFPQLSIIHIGGGTTNEMPWFQLKHKVIARLKFFRFNKPRWQYPIAEFIEKTGNLIRAVIYFILGIFFKRKNLILAKHYFNTLTLSYKSD